MICNSIVLYSLDDSKIGIICSFHFDLRSTCKITWIWRGFCFAVKNLNYYFNVFYVRAIQVFYIFFNQLSYIFLGIYPS